MRADADRQEELDNLLKKVKRSSGIQRIKEIAALVSRGKEKEIGSEKTSGEITLSGEIGVISAHPSLTKRLKRLQAMGAATAGEKPKQRAKVLQTALAFLVLSPFILLIVWLSLCAIGLIFLLASGFSLLFAGSAMRLIYALSM